ncbi:MAG: LytTR family DNA-binding domain-containing protein [Lachnospiraceae bacterium]
MKINVITDDSIQEDEITITCRADTPEIRNLIASLEMMNRQMAVLDGDANTFIDIAEILYMESVDGKCFVYTEHKIYETASRLYELEQKLMPYRFVRISKSVIVNLRKITSLKTYLDRRLLILLCNGEQLIASRQYADEIKVMLGVKGGK